MQNDTFSFLKGSVSKRLVFFNALMATLYLIVITIAFDHGNPILFSLLIFGEIFHLSQVLGYCYTIWNRKSQAIFDDNFRRPIDVFITVCGEPVEVVRETAVAALAMDYPNHTVHILNDGYVANKDNWQNIIELGHELGVNVITRKTPGGAKAGNINYGLGLTNCPYFVIFDADHVPYRNFLKETAGFFADEKLAFVQTPQFYKNQSTNFITQTAWEQQSLFFGPIMGGKNVHNAAFMCGTNMVVSRKAVLEVGGMCETNIAEDFLTSLFIHAKGWKSIYVPKVLAEGLAPEDFLSYYKQQYRWARGSLEVIFKHNPLFMKGLSSAQRIHYLTSASYYLAGIIVLINLLIPLTFLFTGAIAITTSTMALAVAFLPYILLNLYVLQKSSNYSYTFAAISFSLSSFFLQIRAVIGVLLQQKTAFAVTPKQQQKGNFLYLAIPHLIYIALAVAGTTIALLREGFSASLTANLSWVVINICIFAPFIRAALPLSGKEKVILSRSAQLEEGQL